MPSMLARLPSASFRPPPGTSPSSPKAVPYSPIRPGPVAPGASTTGPAARLGPVGSGSGPGSSASNAASAQGPSARLAHAASGGVGPLLGALPASRWQPSARRSSTAAPGGSARGGIAEGDRGSMAAAARKGSRPGSASFFGPAPAGSLAGLEPELQQRLEGAAAQLASPEWKSRLEGLQAVQAAVGSAVGALPTAAQLWLADSLRERVGDANLRCQQQVRRHPAWVSREERDAAALDVRWLQLLCPDSLAPSCVPLAAPAPAVVIALQRPAQCRLWQC